MKYGTAAATPCLGEFLLPVDIHTGKLPEMLKPKEC